MKSQVSEHGLDGVEIFQDLEEAERSRLAAELETLSLKRGDVLVRQGEMADALYVVVTGRFTITVSGRREPVAELGPGQPVGEIAFLAGGARTATVTVPCWCGRRWPRPCCRRRCASTAWRRRARSMRSRAATTTCCSSPSRS